MTIDEMKKALEKKCIELDSCDECPLDRQCRWVHGDPKEIEQAYNIMFYERIEQGYNVISKPKHYNREGAMECLDEMELIFGLEAVKHFCLCNWLKYRYRAADKNGAEDIAKSDYYIRKYKELCEDE